MDNTSLNNQQSYDDDSINMAVGAQILRERPAQFLGSEQLAGARHTFTEIYGNALDEKTAGYGNQIDVHYYEDGSVSIRDYGRGVPMGWNNKPHIQNWNWHVIYNALHGGGKDSVKDNENQRRLRDFTDWDNFDERDFNYIFSVGLNGVGAAATQYTSEFCHVKSYRNGVCTYRDFKKGIPIINGEPKRVELMTPEEIKAIPELKEPTDEPDGTFVHWKPDIEVFSDVDLGSDYLFDVCKDISDVAGIKLIFTDDKKGINMVFESGTLVDLVKKRCDGYLESEDIITNNILRHGTTTVKNTPFIWVCKCSVAIARVSKSIEHRAYHNSVRMRNGMHFDGIKDAIYEFLSSKAKLRGIKLDSKDCDEIFSIAVSTYSNHASFRNQTKDGVEDNFIYSAVKSAIGDKLEVEYAKGTESVVDAVEKVIKEAELRIQVKEYEKVARETKKISREKAPEKFVSCDAYEKKRYNEAELWITEGDSAKGSVKSARNKVFQAIYPIRGKGLNVAKAPLKRILENKEIREIFALLGTGFDLNLKGENFFNMDNLKFNKIIIATDADEDGYQIRVLLFLTFYKLAPRLITEGHVYIAETPRFRLVFPNGNVMYARNDAHRDELLKQYGSAKVSRYKGLGEVDADVLRETTVHPDTRNLIQLNCDLTNKTECDIIDAVFGTDKYKQRKGIIASMLGCSINDMIDDTALELEQDDYVDEENELVSLED